MANTKFPTKEGNNQNSRFHNGKRPYPPETKANQNKCQTQTKTPTPPEVENTKFHQLSLYKPQDKHRLLKHKASQILFKRELKQSSDQA
jgi:hypothetical protein